MASHAAQSVLSSGTVTYHSGSRNSAIPGRRHADREWLDVRLRRTRGTVRGQGQLAVLWKPEWCRRIDLIPDRSVDAVGIQRSRRIRIDDQQMHALFQRRQALSRNRSSTRRLDLFPHETISM